MLPMKGPAEEAKREDLEKFVVNDDLENFFSNWSLVITSRERRVGRISQEKR